MLTVLALASAEALINRAIAADLFTQEALATLEGKTLRIIIDTPSLAVDVLLGARIRFEPVVQHIFEPQGGIIATPDCTITVSTIGELASLIAQPMGNLPISGDHRVLMQLQTILQNFSPDIGGEVSAMIGTDGASFINMLSTEFSGVLKPIGTLAKDAARELLSMVNAKPDAAISALDGEIRQKKDTLLRLQSELERTQAQLNQLNAHLDDADNAKSAQDTTCHFTAENSPNPQNSQS